MAPRSDQPHPEGGVFWRDLSGSRSRTAGQTWAMQGVLVGGGVSKEPRRIWGAARLRWGAHGRLHPRKPTKLRTSNAHGLLLARAQGDGGSHLQSRGRATAAGAAPSRPPARPVSGLNRPFHPSRRWRPGKGGQGHLGDWASLGHTPGPFTSEGLCWWSGCAEHPGVSAKGEQ